MKKPPESTDPPDPRRRRAARTELRNAARDTSTQDIRSGNEQGKKFKAALGEFWRAEVEPKGSKGPDR